MGTRGLYAYRYRGLYFIRYNHSDSYPQGLGKKLADQIPTDPEEFKVWIEALKVQYEAEPARLQKLVEEGGEPQDEYEYFEYIQKPSSEPPSNDIFIEWTYTFDLDRMAFVVDDNAYLKLDNLPRGEDGEEWIKYLAVDATGLRCLAFSMPKQYFADIHPEVAISKAGCGAYEALRPRIMKTEDWMSGASKVAQEFTAALAKCIIQTNYGVLSTLHQFPTNTWKFYIPAERLLRACAPDFLSVEVGARELKPADPDYNSVGREPPKFNWFRGCLIMMASRLDSEENLKGSVGDVVLHIRKSGLSNCTALIWSVRHVAVVSVREDEVAHSAALPILASLCDDSCEKLEVGLRLLARCLCPAYTEADDAFHTDGALASDSTAEVRGHAEGKDEPRLPLDVLLRVMQLADTQTHKHFSILSKAIRAEWAKHPRIGKNWVLRSDEDSFIARVADGPEFPLKIFSYGYCEGSDDPEDVKDAWKTSILRPDGCCFQISKRARHQMVAVSGLPAGAVKGNVD